MVAVVQNMYLTNVEKIRFHLIEKMAADFLFLLIKFELTHYCEPY